MPAAPRGRSASPGPKKRALSKTPAKKTPTKKTPTKKTPTKKTPTKRSTSKARKAAQSSSPSSSEEGQNSDNDSDDSLVSDVAAGLDAVEHKLSTSKLPRSTFSVFFYVPQFIGYFRVLSTLVSIFYAIHAVANKGEYHKRAIVGYAVSFVLDAVDGVAARKFDQSSHFGAVLDMITDRCTTAAFLVILTWLYTEKWQRLMLIIVLMLDVASHWVAMYSSLKFGLHHKETKQNKKQFFLVRWYYSNYYFFGACCVGAEITYMVAFAKAFNPKGIFFYPFTHDQIFYLPLFFCCVKNLVNAVQLFSASKIIAKEDAEEWNRKNIKDWEPEKE